MSHDSLFFFFFLFPSLIIIYKFRPDVVSSLLCRRRNPVSLFRADWYACMRARAHRRRFIYCPSSPANSTTGHNALKRCQTRFPSRVNNGGMDWTGWRRRTNKLNPTRLASPSPRVNERERETGEMCRRRPRWTFYTERISGNERFILYLARVYIYIVVQAFTLESVSFDWSFHCLWGPTFDMKVGPHQPDDSVVSWPYLAGRFFVEGGRHGASMDGPLVFAYHQLPSLILHPPRSNCDATFLAYNTRLIYRETRNIACCCCCCPRFPYTHTRVRASAGERESYAAPDLHPRSSSSHFYFSRAIFQSPGSSSLFFLSREIQNGNHPSMRKREREKRDSPCFDYHPTSWAWGSYPHRDWIDM